MLKFSNSNKKLGKNIYSFSLPAGYTCPFAQNCKCVVGENGKIKDLNEKFKDLRFRCYAASMEALRPRLYESVRYNYKQLSSCKTSDDITDMILKSIPKKAKTIRLHVGGDFYSEKYFKAWIKVAKTRKDILFYAYTKSIPYWIKNLKLIPENLVLSASYGGKHDDLIKKYKLKNVRVFFSEATAKSKLTPIDKDDSLARDPKIKNFGVLIHGPQPSKSYASKAVQLIKRNK